MTSCFIEIDKQSVIEIELFDTSVAKKFLNELKWHISNSSINHQECFYEYAKDDEVRADLLNSINQINHFLKHEYIVLPKDINWNDSNLYNRLHVYFEKLNGEWGKPTRLMSIAPSFIKNAIRHLNFAIHRLESHSFNRNFYLSWDKNTYRRVPLEENEYELFTDQYIKNVAYLSYVEVGKHLKELYQDNLSPNYGAYKNLHYVGAEIDIKWGVESHSIFSNDFKEWTKKHNIDLPNKKLGVGLMPVGQFKGSDNNFTKDSKITSITIKE